jgi:dTDP-4-amino-4,6-dideoxygalactose transaminase
MKIPFNKPFLTGKELEYIKDAAESLHLSGNGKYTKLCQSFFEKTYGIKKALLTTSCTDALEMAAILTNIKEGDEVIMPSYTFVSTANAFVLRGAKIVFCDSRKDHPGIDEALIESLVTKKTKAIVPVHYAGVACDMEMIMDIANRHDLFVIEDAAQAIESYFTFSDGTQKALGSIGHLATFSFHETKNIISGEGGLLAINDERFIERAEIIWEKGTNRSAFFRGEIDKYSWVDIGSSFLPSEITAAFLWGQLENVKFIQDKRNLLWSNYLELLNDEHFARPKIPSYASNNSHMFYLICKSEDQRSKLISTLKQEGITAVFHYLSLNKSKFNQSIDEKPDNLIMSDFYSTHLLRLPLFFELTLEQQTKIVHLLNLNSL